MAAVWDQSDQTGGNLLLLLALADFANDEGECWPALSTLGRKARMTERHVRRVLRELEAAGEIERMPGGGQNGTNRYLIHPKTPPETQGGDILSGGTSTSGGEDAGVRGGEDVGVPQSVIRTVIESSRDTNALTLEAGRFVEWFLELLRRTGAPEPRITPGIRNLWADTYEKLRRIDGRTKNDIKAVCEWARGDRFWAQNFLSPAKLRQKNGDGIFYYDVFSNKLRTTNANSTTGQSNGRGFESSRTNEYAGYGADVAPGA